MYLVTSVIGATVICVLAGTAAAQPAWFDEASASNFVQQLQQSSGVPSISAAIMRLDGSDFGAVASGVRRLGDPTQVTTADRYHIGSNAKAVTSTAIAQLVQQGVLSWDTTVGQALGSSVPGLDPSYRDVTMRELLTLRGGVPMIFTFPEMEPYAHFPGTGPQQRQTVAATILSQPRVYAPGVTAYSNASYTIAAAIAERLSGQSWESMVRQQLEGRMGIRFEAQLPGQDGTDQPWGHGDVNYDGGYVPLNPNGPQQFPIAFSPAGNLSMTMSDLALFGQQHLRALSGLSNTLGLTQELVSQMHDAQGHPLAMGWSDLSDPGIGGFGDGWIGSTDFFTSILLIDRERGLAIAVATNGFNAAGEAPAAELFLAAQAMAAATVPSAPTAGLLMAAALVGTARRRRR